jgi:hypothetical protein
MKTTLRFHLCPIRKATIKNTTPTTNAGKDARKKECSYTGGMNINFTTSMENSMEFPLKN